MATGSMTLQTAIPSLTIQSLLATISQAEAKSRSAMATAKLYGDRPELALRWLNDADKEDARAVRARFHIAQAVEAAFPGLDPEKLGRVLVDASYDDVGGRFSKIVRLKTNILWHDSTGGEHDCCDVLVEYSVTKGYPATRQDPGSGDEVEILSLPAYIPDSFYDSQELKDECLQDWHEDQIAAAERAYEARAEYLRDELRWQG